MSCIESRYMPVIGFNLMVLLANQYHRSSFLTLFGLATRILVLHAAWSISQAMVMMMVS